MSPSTLKQERIALHIHRTFGPAIVIPMTCREEAYTTADYILKKEEPDNQMHIMFDDILTKLVSGMCIGSTRYLQCIILMNVPIPYFYYPHMNTENLLGETSSKQTLIISRKLKFVFIFFMRGLWVWGCVWWLVPSSSCSCSSFRRGHWNARRFFIFCRIWWLVHAMF